MANEESIGKEIVQVMEEIADRIPEETVRKLYDIIGRLCMGEAKARALTEMFPKESSLMNPEFLKRYNEKLEELYVFPYSNPKTRIAYDRFF